jgi:hypothetical protein
MDGTLATSLAAGLAVFALFLAIPTILRSVNPENAILFRTLNFLTWVVRLRYDLLLVHGAARLRATAEAVQALEYYNKLFPHAYSESQRHYLELWHSDE